MAEHDQDQPRRGEETGRIPAGKMTTMPQTALAAQRSAGPTLAFSHTTHAAKMQAASDRDLLHALASGDEAALDELVTRKTRPLVQLAYRIVGDYEEARDVVQVTFLRLWEHRARFDDRWSPNTWIYRIATNLAIDQLRSRRSREKSTEPVRWHLVHLADSAARREGSRLDEDEVMAIFHELAAGLSEKQRAVFLLREIEGLPSKEVAEIVDCRESTVRNHLFNARKYLRDKLQERYPEYARGFCPEVAP